MIECRVKIALNICTYQRRERVIKNLSVIKKSHFFDKEKKDYYGNLHIYIIDNASNLHLESDAFVHYFRNRNEGGSGGFQRGIEEIRKSDANFTHVVFMDDDVIFENSTLYILYEFLKKVDEKNRFRPVAGRMLCLDRPNIQYTAAEKWNGGDISHVEYLRDLSKEEYVPGKVIYDVDADYGGWWFCCFPMKFIQKNDILPFFIHCDDVEYGLRCGEKPIIIEGVHVWHETFDRRVTPLIQYYDTRNRLFVNSLYGLLPSGEQIINDWKKEITRYHLKKDWLTEYYIILAMNDFMKGLKWLKNLNSEEYHNHLKLAKSTRVKNAILWRSVILKYHMGGLKKRLISKVTINSRKVGVN